MAIRAGLFGEVVVMAFDTVRTNKMRSGLTVLGVVIGITSIVGMTAMIRGFDQSLRDMIRAVGPNTIFVQRFGITSFAGGAEIRQSAEAPEPDDFRRAGAGSAGGRRSSYVDIQLGPARPTDAADGCSTGSSRPRSFVVLGTTENLRRRHADPDPRGPVLQRHRAAVPQECRRARQHRVQAAVRAVGHRSDRQVRPRGRRTASRSSASSTSGRRPGGFNPGAG